MPGEFHRQRRSACVRPGHFTDDIEAPKSEHPRVGFEMPPKTKPARAAPVVEVGDGVARVAGLQKVG